MRIRSLALMAILLAASITVAIRGSWPALALATGMVVLMAWALVSFRDRSRWR